MNPRHRNLLLDLLLDLMLVLVFGVFIAGWLVVALS